MYMKDEKIVEIDDYRLELENRIRNLLWTISGDYTLNMKVDVSLYLRSKAIALYEASSRALWRNIMTGICLVYIW